MQTKITRKICRRFAALDRRRKAARRLRTAFCPHAARPPTASPTRSSPSPARRNGPEEPARAAFLMRWLLEESRPPDHAISGLPRDAVGRALYIQPFTGRVLLQRAAFSFGTRLEAFRAACTAMGGLPLQVGDAGRVHPAGELPPAHALLGGRRWSRPAPNCTLQRELCRRLRGRGPRRRRGTCCATRSRQSVRKALRGLPFTQTRKAPICHCEAKRRGHQWKTVAISPVTFPRCSRVLRDCTPKGTSSRFALRAPRRPTASPMTSRRCVRFFSDGRNIGSTCKPLSVTFGDSSPKGSQGTSRPAMTTGGRRLQACHCVLRMQQAAKFVIARLRETVAISRYRQEHGKAPGKIRCCLPEICTSAYGLLAMTSRRCVRF